MIAAGTMSRWVVDFKQAGRQLARSPGFSAVAILTLTIGVGVTAAMVGLMDALLLRPPFQVAHPEQVVRLRFHLQDGADSAVAERTHYPAFLDLQASGAFETVAASATAAVSIGTGAEAVLASGMLVTDDFFHVLGTHPRLGTFDLENTADNSADLVVVSEPFWKQHFGGAPTVVGQKLTVDGKLYSVAGVAPAGLQALSPKPTDVWLPLAHGAVMRMAPPDWLHNRGPFWISVIASLPNGTTALVSEERATAALRGRRRDAGDTGSTITIQTTSIVPGRGADKSLESRVSLWLSGVSALVLLLACANVSNLVLMRAHATRRDSFIRLTLGATSADLARRAWADTLVLVLPSIVGAVWVSFVLRSTTAAFLSEAIPLSRSLWDPRATGIVIGSGLLALILMATVSAWQIRSSVKREALLLGASPVGSGKRMRFVLLAVQAAVCLTLVFVASLFAMSLHRVERLDLGVDLDRTVQLTINLPEKYRNREDAKMIYSRAAEALNAHPNIERIALAGGSPFMSGQGAGPLIAGRTHAELWAKKGEVAYRSLVGSGFFTTVGAESLRGRDFLDTDNIGAPRVAIINGPLARYLWPDREPLGECISLDPDPRCIRVVGVLGGVWKFSALKRNRMAVYLPLAQVPSVAPSAIYIRPRGETADVLRQIRTIVQSLDPELPAVRAVVVREIVDPEFRPWRLGATVFVVFAAIALAVAAIGLYSMIALTTTLRFKELGIRMALGAQRAHIVCVAMREATGAVAVGLTIGIIIAVFGGKKLGGVLFETSPRDSTVLLQTALALFVVGVVAVLVPIWRAFRIDPARVLKSS